MEIFDTMLCVECNEQYLGEFYMRKDGSIICKDCNEPLLYNSGLTTRHVERPSKSPDTDIDALLNETYMEMLERDMQELDTKLILHNIPTSEVTTVEGVFYQDNRVDIVMYYYRQVYKCVKYLDSMETQYRDYCMDIIKKYQLLRQRILTTKEEHDYINHIKGSNTVQFDIYMEHMG